MALLKRLYETNAYGREIGSYWQTTAKPPKWPRLSGNHQTETLIIGAGYTGVNAALELNKSGTGQDMIIVDANQPGWGASGRNGGFCCMGGSKLSTKKQISKFGEAQTRLYFQEQKNAIQTVRDNLSQYDIQADLHSFGETQLAHRQDQVKELQWEQHFLHQFAGIECELLSKDELLKNGFKSNEFFAALTNPNGFAVNPLKYISGLAEQINQQKIAAYGDSPVLKLQHKAGQHLAITENGVIKAKNLIIATNGYSSENLPEWLSARLLPILTNILVTRPLNQQDLETQGWSSHQMCYDTRNALHYFRLMPGINGEGPRMLFGMRGGTSASKQTLKKMRQRIRKDFETIFPHWHNVETPYFWSGLACLSKGLTSFTGPVPEIKNAWASLAYHGNGVAMGSHCGRLIGKMIKGDIDPKKIPAAMRAPLNKFPTPALRRHYLNAAYRWYEWMDG